ncbi:MAG TPA: cupin domain-containing protein [Candidatus Binatia bacterium]|nr:cupin domain-containing protein [Candidatus Binatia bacterium]
MAKNRKLPAEAGLDKSLETRPGAVSRVNAEYYRWGHDCDAWHLVKDPQLTVIEELMPPGAAEVRHYHKEAQQFFYILAGEAIMEVEDDPVLVPAGSGIRILPGVWHQIRNPSSSALRLLVISHPPSHGDKWTE